MPRSQRLYLGDIKGCIEDTESFTQGKKLRDYEQDSMLRAAVERKFTIIGEAMSQMAHHYPSSKPRIEHTRKIVDFRNLLIHEYNDVDDAVVWSIIQDLLTPFEAEIDQWILDLETPHQ